ncbi:nicotinamide riboside transporter PnuC [Sphingomonas sp. PB4P5]|uniref:nicotinamide riboside transporter PnuC n=1 Tax=Parasphingomonas puruogangriensis TaxID=3096155 RepID=UPI002FCBABB9
MCPLELLAALLVLINVALVARRSVWNYAFAIAGVALYALVFYQAKLYSDMLLQGFFLVINLYGWRHWSRSLATAGRVSVSRLTPAARAVWLAGIALATFAWGSAMHRLTDAALPFVDAGIAMTSIVAQILLSRQKLENWLLWIAVDLVAIGVYAARDLRVTALLYVLLLGISIWGLIDWRRAERAA